MNNFYNTFSAKALQKTILETGHGTVQIIDKATHIGVIHSKQSFTFIKNWFAEL